MNKFVKDKDILKCELIGKFDTLNSSNTEEDIIKNITPEINQVVLDLGEVDYISSSFLRIITKLVKQLGKENIKITNVQPTVMKVFKIANFSEIVIFE